MTKKKANKRVDAKKNIDKVAASLVKNPLQTTREVAEETGVGKSTVATHMKNLDKVGQKDDRILNLTEGDFEIMTKIQEIKKKRLEVEGSDVNNSDVDKWENTATKRYTLFRGDATDDGGGAKTIDSIEIL